MKMKSKKSPLISSLFIASLLIAAASSSQADSSNQTLKAPIIPANDIYASYHSEAVKIYQKMTQDQRIGQLLLPSYVLLANSVSTNGTQCTNDLNNGAPPNVLAHDCGLDQISKYHLGAVLTGGGPYFNAPTAKNWLDLNQLAISQHDNSLDPLLLTGSDVIHGNMHAQGGVMFPHDIGLGVTHDPALVKEIGLLAGEDSLATGFNWAYMPTVAVAQDIRWGRSYESFSLDPALVKLMSNAYISGFQSIQNNQITGVLSTVKHFIGDGATQYGFDEGDDQWTLGQQAFWNENGQGYEGAAQADVGSLMVSYSAIDGDTSRMHFGGKWNLLNQFKSDQGVVGSDGKRYRFTGFVVSDWNGPTRAAYFYENAVHKNLDLEHIIAKSINGGVDMIMLGQGDVTQVFNPNSAPNFTNVGEVFTATQAALNDHLISQQRLEDAVVRILQVKLAMKKNQENSLEGNNYTALQAKERKLSLKAAEESLVLLKNNNQLLPINSTNKIKNVIFVGDTNDLGLQNGGWTINWQGQKGSQYFEGKDAISSGATTLENGIKNILGNKVHYFDNPSSTSLSEGVTSANTLVIGLVSEMPYAEFMGDIGNPAQHDDWYEMGAANGYNLYLGLPQSQSLDLFYTPAQAELLSSLRQKGVKIISVVYSGRPVIISGNANSPLENSDAVIAAFLPGTLGGQAIANSIFGAYHFRSESGPYGDSNTLSFPWPRSMNDIKNYSQHPMELFKLGYGLST